MEVNWYNRLVFSYVDLVAAPQMILKTFRFLCLSLLATSSLPAMIQMPSVFGDNMVLQQQAPLPFWGKADPGEKITVKFRDQSVSGTAGKDGLWRVVLKPVPAGGPFEVTVKGKEMLRFQNVLVGEVWLASGQSNMEMTVAESSDAPKEIQEANHPELRFYQAPRTFTKDPSFDVAGKWVVCTPETIGSISAVAYSFGREVQQSLLARGKKGAVGMLISSWGGTPAIAWTPRSMLQTQPKYAELVTKADTKPNATNQRQLAPSVLYNGMIAPLAPYALRGFIWFQGETDALNNESYSYRTLLPMLIASWRKAFENEKLAFLIVQISSFVNYTPTSKGPYGDDSARPGSSTWAELREAQILVSQQPGNGLAVTTDIGHPEEIHFPNKREVGRRLALVARKQVYGEPVVAAGPRFQKMEKSGESVRVYFTQAEEGLRASGEPLKGFALAGADQKFIPAQAVIEKDTVVVTAPGLTDPVAVRYNWANNPAGNLFNGTGLPAEPFRSDDWPGITQ